MRVSNLSIDEQVIRIADEVKNTGVEHCFLLRRYGETLVMCGPTPNKDRKVIKITADSVWATCCDTQRPVYLNDQNKNRETLSFLKSFFDVSVSNAMIVPCLPSVQRVFVLVNKVST